MPEREPAAWETNAPGPFLRLERAHGAVDVYALGSDRFSVRAPEREQLIVGFDAARETAHTLAGELDRVPTLGGTGSRGACASCSTW